MYFQALLSLISFPSHRRARCRRFVILTPLSVRLVEKKMNPDGTISDKFEKAWLRMLHRDSVKEILRLELTNRRKMVKILNLLATEEFGRLEYEWFLQRKEIKQLKDEKEVN